MKAVQILWPVLGQTKAFTTGVVRQREADLAAIQSADWSKLGGVLEHARVLTETENERKRSADTKASLYLAVIAALVPILGALVTDFYRPAENAPSGAFGYVTLSLFALGTAYLLACGIWSFRTLKVSKYTRVDINELVLATNSPSPEQEIAREMLVAVRYNRDEVNEKTSRIRMAHEFLVRTFVCFSTLLLCIVFWQPIADFVAFAAPWAEAGLKRLCH